MYSAAKAVGTINNNSFVSSIQGAFTGHSYKNKNRMHSECILFFNHSKIGTIGNRTHGKSTYHSHHSITIISPRF